MSHRVLITPPLAVAQWQTYHGAWEERDLEIVLAPKDILLTTEDERIEYLHGAVAVVAASEPYTERVFASCPMLRIIARAGVGYDAIDVEAATRYGVWVTITPGANDRTVAEATWMLILALSRQLEAHLNSVRGGGWERLLPPEVTGKTLGIIGVGRIGKRVAQIARAFEMTVLGYDAVEDAAFAQAVGLRYVGLRELLSQSDIVTLHAPKLPETTNLLNAETLRWMKPSAYLINTARGGIVDERALLDALNAERLAGAALDVFEQEPLPADHPLRTHPKVLVTPHIAGISAESYRRMILQAMDNILAALDGKRPPGAVNEVKG
ncbi:MAG: phosphoglycerate dehydrogenase [Abditibacteriales bacterium]|nr:phosphoglycerate dehydrogenase [Abditibacteriales bacterium]MDW8367926.1 phosphoglycerate dehydrogenase [Abditibacteriales bacterium]